VRRNAIRRVLREAFRTSAQRAVLPVMPGYTLTLMVLCRSRSPVRNRVLRSDLAKALDILVAALTGSQFSMSSGS